MIETNLKNFKREHFIKNVIAKSMFVLEILENNKNISIQEAIITANLEEAKITAEQDKNYCQEVQDLLMERTDAIILKMYEEDNLSLPNILINNSKYFSEEDFELLKAAIAGYFNEDSLSLEAIDIVKTLESILENSEELPQLSVEEVIQKAKNAVNKALTLIPSLEVIIAAKENPIFTFMNKNLVENNISVKEEDMSLLQTGAENFLELIEESIKACVLFLGEISFKDIEIKNNVANHANKMLINKVEKVIEVLDNNTYYQHIYNIGKKSIEENFKVDLYKDFNIFN